MATSPVNPLVVLAAALLTASAAMIVADLATAQARLRRRLDKELAILARLEVQGAKDRLTVIVARHSWELVHRSEEEPHHNRWLRLIVAAVLVLISSLVGLRQHAINPLWSNGNTGTDLATWLWGLSVGLLMSVVPISVLVSESNARRKFVAAKMINDAIVPVGEPIEPG